MTKLVELPSNIGGIIAVDPHAVTAVAPYRGPIAGHGSQVFDMCTVWLNDRSIFVSAWSVETVLEALNGVRHGEAAIFAAGYRAGIDDDRMIADVEMAWKRYLTGREGL